MTTFYMFKFKCSFPSTCMKHPFPYTHSLSVRFLDLFPQSTKRKKDGIVWTLNLWRESSPPSTTSLRDLFLPLLLYILNSPRTHTPNFLSGKGTINPLISHLRGSIEELDEFRIERKTSRRRYF